MGVQIPTVSANTTSKAAKTGNATSRTAKKGMRKKQRARRTVTNGRVNVKATFNNTIVTVTDELGNKLVQTSAGQSGFKGSRKSTPFAAQVAAEAAAVAARDDFSIKVVEISRNGPGPGAESAIRVFINMGFKISSFVDKTGVPHNGVRSPKKRRV